MELLNIISIFVAEIYKTYIFQSLEQLDFMKKLINVTMLLTALLIVAAEVRMRRRPTVPTPRKKRMPRAKSSLARSTLRMQPYTILTRLMASTSRNWSQTSNTTSLANIPSRVTSRKYQHVSSTLKAATHQNKLKVSFAKSMLRQPRPPKAERMCTASC